MRKMMVVAVMLAILVAVSLSPVAAESKGKVKLCHFDQGGPGHVIEVNKNAVKAHLSNHDDCLRFKAKGDACKCIRKKGKKGKKH